MKASSNVQKMQKVRVTYKRGKEKLQKLCTKCVNLLLNISGNISEVEFWWLKFGAEKDRTER